MKPPTIAETSLKPTRTTGGYSAADVTRRHVPWTSRGAAARCARSSPARSRLSGCCCPRRGGLTGPLRCVGQSSPVPPKAAQHRNRRRAPRTATSRGCPPAPLWLDPAAVRGWPPPPKGQLAATAAPLRSAAGCAAGTGTGTGPGEAGTRRAAPVGRPALRLPACCGASRRRRRKSAVLLPLPLPVRQRRVCAGGARRALRR